MQPDSLIITPEILKTIALIDEFKGAWKALGNLAPERLTRLQHVATIESIGSSTRIEGSRLSNSDVEVLLGRLQIQAFSTRDEQEVAGYAHVMEMIYSSWSSMPLTEGTVRQLHRELLRFSDKDDWHRGAYKSASNSVAAFDEDGRQVGIVFETADPFDTPLLIGELIAWTNQAFTDQRLHPLLVIGMFVVDFLAIHPFQDGNGRLSRALTTLLLLQQDYAYVPYSSLESVIEQRKQGYYLALRKTQMTIRSESPDWQPWLSFFLDAIHAQVSRLQVKAEREQLLSRTVSPLGQQIVVHVREHGRATLADLEVMTGANRNTIRSQLRTLVDASLIVRHGSGRGTWYSLP